MSQIMNDFFVCLILFNLYTFHETLSEHLFEKQATLNVRWLVIQAGDVAEVRVVPSGLPSFGSALAAVASAQAPNRCSKAVSASDFCK